MPRALVSTETIEKERAADEAHNAAAPSVPASVVGRQTNESDAFSTLIARDAVFYFGFDDRLSKGATAPRLRIVSTDGAHERFYAMQEGTVVGSQRVFAFREARSGKTYRGELVYGAERFKLFGASDISRLADAADSYDALNAAPDRYNLKQNGAATASAAHANSDEETNGEAAATSAEI